MSIIPISMHLCEISVFIDNNLVDNNLSTLVPYFSVSAKLYQSYYKRDYFLS